MAVNYQKKIVTDGLVLCLDAGDVKSYPGSGTVWYDRSGNSNSGILTGDVGYSDGTMVFDGINDYVNGVHNTQVNITGDVTVEAWFRVTSTRSDWVRVFGKGDSGNRTYGLWYNTGGVFLYQRYGISTMNAQYNSTVVLNRWYHMVGTSISNSHILYLNGISVATSSTGTTFYSSTTPYTIGYHGSIHTYHLGNIDKCRLYNRGLSQQEILQNYNAQKGRFGL